MQLAGANTLDAPVLNSTPKTKSGAQRRGSDLERRSKRYGACPDVENRFLSKPPNIALILTDWILIVTEASEWGILSIVFVCYL